MYDTNFDERINLTNLYLSSFDKLNVSLSRLHHASSDAPILLFHYRSDTDTFEARNGRYRYFAPQAFLTRNS